MVAVGASGDDGDSGARDAEPHDGAGNSIDDAADDQFSDESEPNGNLIGYQSSDEHRNAGWSRMRGSFDQVIPQVNRRERYRSAAQRQGPPRKPKGR
jgi:hypothetical protein